MKKEFKACPFCGRSPIMEDNGADYFWVKCEECGCELRGENSVTEARDIWNNRKKAKKDK